MCYQATQVTSMIMEGYAAMGVLNHKVVNLVDTTLKRFYKATTPNDGIELYRDVGLAKFIEHQLATEVLLLYHIVETSQLFRGMRDVTDEQGRLILKDCHLCRGRAWIDDKYLHIAARARE